MKHRTKQRMYVREAAFQLALARFAVRLLPATRLVAWARRPPRRINRFAGPEVGWITWAVETIGSKRWMQASCLPRALAAQSMLRRRGIASRLCLGVAREGRALSAHAWIELGQDVIVGGDAAPRFTRLVEFGGDRV
jgi:hypothetical protein